MDAPKCQKIPSCGKHHFGDCGTTHVPSEKKAARKPEKKSTLIVDARLPLTSDEMLARIESLEDRMDAMDKRRVYQKELMRKRRKK